MSHDFPPVSYCTDDESESADSGWVRVGAAGVVRNVGKPQGLKPRLLGAELSQRWKLRHPKARGSVVAKGLASLRGTDEGVRPYTSSGATRAGGRGLRGLCGRGFAG